MTEKRFTHVGIATMKTRTKLKYANGDINVRVKGMERLGFTNIEFVALPSSMTKQEAFNSVEVIELAKRHNFQLAAVKEVKATPVAIPETEETEAVPA